MAEKLVTKNDLLNKLRAYSKTPDDDNIVYKKKIIVKSLFIICSQ